ncbi:GNAT family acetyltransferase [Flavobacterium psychrophilum]|nr:GNAT family acetyltransferase [Flavobacterium psychrophilum]AOE52343.1 GNAT family acetyltransferase [Flavobacterium psychrophilum]
MDIRSYSPSDKGSIIDLLRLNTPNYFSIEEEADLNDYLDNQIDIYYVVEDNGLLIGSGGINITEDRKTARISWDIVHPDYQGKGIGQLLTHYRIRKIKEMNGIEKISVRTSQFASKFYEKFGFKLLEVVKDYWAKGIDMYRMELM